MANELTYQFQIALNNVSLVDNYSSSGKQATQAVAFLVRNVQTVGTTAGGDALGLGGVLTPGFAIFVNMDIINYVEVGSNVAATFYPFLKLKPGEQCGPMRIGIAAPYARANTLAAKLFYIIYND